MRAASRPSSANALSIRAKRPLWASPVPMSAIGQERTSISLPTQASYEIVLGIGERLDERGNRGISPKRQAPLRVMSLAQHGGRQPAVCSLDDERDQVTLWQMALREHGFATTKRDVPDRAVLLFPSHDAPDIRLRNVHYGSKADISASRLRA